MLLINMILCSTKSLIKFDFKIQIHFIQDAITFNFILLNILTIFDALHVFESGFIIKRSIKFGMTYVSFKRLGYYYVRLSFIFKVKHISYKNDLLSITLQSFRTSQSLNT